MEVSDEWLCSEVGIGIGIIIFVSNMDSGIEGTKLCRAFDTLMGRDTIQRDMGRLEGWACVNLMKFNQVQGLAHRLGQSQAK